MREEEEMGGGDILGTKLKKKLVKESGNIQLWGENINTLSSH